MSLRRLVIGIVLAWFVTPAQAGQVTYFFLEGSDGPHPGHIAAGLSFSTPPADPDAAWKTSDDAAIVQLRVRHRLRPPRYLYVPDIVGDHLRHGPESGRRPDSRSRKRDLDLHSDRLDPWPESAQ